MAVVALVIDASVAGKWLLPEPDSEKAEQILDRLRSRALRAHAPDFIVAEVANVLWKRTRAGKTPMRKSEAVSALTAFLESPLELEPVRELARPALELAALIPCTVYDALYVTLALRENALFITADRKLVEVCERHGLAEYVADLDIAIDRLAD